MVENSDIIIGIGGGEVRDELVRRCLEKVRFIPADMNHQKAQRMRARGSPSQ
jgi:hypothetical protein